MESKKNTPNIAPANPMMPTKTVSGSPIKPLVEGSQTEGAARSDFEIGGIVDR